MKTLLCLLFLFPAAGFGKVRTPFLQSNNSCFTKGPLRFNTTATYRIDFGPIPFTWRDSVVNAGMTWNRANSKLQFLYRDNASPATEFSVVTARSLGPNFKGKLAVVDYGWVSFRGERSIGSSRTLVNLDTISDLSPIEAEVAAGKIDVESVLLHEFGHWLRLENATDTSCRSRTVMFEGIAPKERRNTLMELDAPAIREMYGGR